MENKMIKVGITQGDPNGIGMELILRTFAEESIYKYCIPVLYASPKIFGYYKKALEFEQPMYNLVKSAQDAVQGKLNMVISSEDTFEVQMGQPSELAGKEALKSLDAALNDMHHLDALVTAPLDKSTVAPHAPDFTGHTGYIANYLKAENHAMFLVSDELRVALATEHVPVAALGKSLSADIIINKLHVMYNSLREDFGITKPRIAVLGLNPHAGDNGLLGKEEIEIIKPAIKTIFDQGKFVYGPYSADSFFGSGQYKSFDAVLAMYHDQGLIPFKTFAFFDGVNYTAGLPVVRTSPDHGTAYDLVGKGIAETISFRAAIFEAIKIVKNRLQFVDDYKNPLPYAELRRERFRIDF